MLREHNISGLARSSSAPRQQASDMKKQAVAFADAGLSLGLIAAIPYFFSANETVDVNWSKAVSTTVMRGSVGILLVIITL